MKQFFPLILTIVTVNAGAGHPKCAGSYEPEKCEKFQSELESEPAATKAARVRSLEEKRLTTSKIINEAGVASNGGASQWDYSQSSDPMGKGNSHSAAVVSSNTVDFGFPYAGAQRGTLVLRTDPRHGKDVIFHIERGQILCHAYQTCSALVRFDDEQAIKFNAVGAADNSSKTIFLSGHDRFVEKVSKAKRVRLSTTVYQQGSPVFEFEVGGFEKDRYRPKK